MSAGDLRISVKALDDQLQQKLVDYAVRMGRELGVVIRQQMRLLIEDLVKLTPPLGSRDARHESFAQQRRIGENAIARDIERVFVSIESIAGKNTRLGPAIMTALEENNLAVLGRQNSLPELLVHAKVADIADPSKILDQPDEEIHNRFRAHRGRVEGRLPHPYFIKRTADLRTFITREWKKEGKLKGGWGGGATKFGLSLPAWITSHFAGEAIDRTDAADHPSATVTNTVDYISAADADLRIVSYALQDRVKSMTNQMAAMVKRVRL